MKRVSIFGATGSIGQSTLDLIYQAPDRFSVVALSGGHNIDQLAKDAIASGAEIAVTAYDERYNDLKEALAGYKIEVAAGSDAIVEAAKRPADWSMSAIVGSAGLAAGLAALENGNTLALANKESLVAAGPLLMETAAKHNATVLPVDSEHSAIYQALVGEDTSAVERVIITASGGAFRDWPMEKLAGATPEQAATHPNWDMGQRITIDSASLFNKALELIEAKEYFGFSPGQIEVLIHPQSLIHAMIGFLDAGLLAHLGPADMRHAIGYALYWPDRVHLPLERLDFARIGELSFSAPDAKRHLPLLLADSVMRTGGMSGAIFNAAKERALDHFIEKRIGFLNMALVVEQVLNQMEREGCHKTVEFTLHTVMQSDSWARECVDKVISTR